MLFTALINSPKKIVQRNGDDEWNAEFLTFFLRALHRLCLRPYVEKIWGWDEAQQESLLRERFSPDKLKIIQGNGLDIGMLQVEERPDELFWVNLLIHPEHQSKGLGSQIINDLVSKAKIKRLALRLTVLKPNPARKLYERLGFKVIKEDEVRYYMEV